MPFWKDKSLAEMTDAEWESLCDGCGRCCLHVLEDEDTGELHRTAVACRLLDCETCSCVDYANRLERVSACGVITADNVGELDWLPGTCAYRRLNAGRELAWWHPLVSGRAGTVHEAGISVRGRAIPEADVHPDDWECFVL